MNPKFLSFIITLLLMPWLLPRTAVALNEIYLPARVITQPGAEAEDNARTWQGIPGIERSPGGRLWSVWYTGGLSEGASGNYVAIATSGDDGKSWSKPLVLIKGPTEQSSLVDPLPWVDPQGRLWVFYFQTTKEKNLSNYLGTCAIRNDHPDEPDSPWSQPIRIQSGGRVFGKPIILKDGGWLAPFFINTSKPEVKDTCTLLSTNQGATWKLHGGINVPPELRNFSEATLAQRDKGELWTVFRTNYGLHQSVSGDNGATWSPAAPLRSGPNTRACMMKLKSGAYLLVYHDSQANPKSGKYPRDLLTAWLSTDEGRTWPHKLLLDGSKGISYPDGVQAPDGRIYIAYDQSRYDGGSKAILFCIFTEQDVKAGKLINPESRLRQLINRATGTGNIRELNGVNEDRLRDAVNKKQQD